ncbi:MAG: ATP-binding cassette domain-containing protein [Clostridiales bacterium]
MVPNKIRIEIYGFLGPNGAGKTTTMKMILGLLKPTSGNISVFNKDLQTNLYNILSNIGMLIERAIFYENMTAYQNMALHLEYMGYYNKENLEKSFMQVNLKNIENKKVKDFSQGMKQRLAIARTISTKPKLLILNEPINGLDPIGVKEIRALLLDLAKTQNITIFISSHILSEIEQIADIIGVLNNGTLIEEVSMDKVHQENIDYIEIVVDDMKKASYILMVITFL